MLLPLNFLVVPVGWLKTVLQFILCWLHPHVPWGLSPIKSGSWQVCWWEINEEEQGKKSVMNLFIDNTCYMKWWSFFSGICSLLYCEHGRNTQLLLGNHLNCLSGRLAKIAVSKCLQSTVTFCIKAFVRTARLSQSLLKDTASYRLIVHNKINSLHYVLATIHQTKLFRAWNLAEELKS